MSSSSSRHGFFNVTDSFSTGSCGIPVCIRFRGRVILVHEVVPVVVLEDGDVKMGLDIAGRAIESSSSSSSS